MGLSVSFITFSLVLSKLMKKAERSKEAEQKFLQTLIDTIPNPVFYQDLSGSYLGCDKAYETITGIPRGELTGQSVFDVAPAHLAEAQHRSGRELFLSGEVQGAGL